MDTPREYLWTNTQADNQMLIEAVNRAMNRRTLSSHCMVVVEPRPGAPDEWEAWLRTNVQRDWRISGEFVDFANENDAFAFRMRFG